MKGLNFSSSRQHALSQHSQHLSFKSTSFDLLWLTLTCFDLLWLALTCFDLLWLPLTCFVFLWLILTYFYFLWLALTYFDLLWLILTYFDLLWLTLTCFDLLWLTLTSDSRWRHDSTGWQWNTHHNTRKRGFTNRHPGLSSGVCVAVFSTWQCTRLMLSKSRVMAKFSSLKINVAHTDISGLREGKLVW